MGKETVDNFLSKFGLGPKYVPSAPKKHICPVCGHPNATIKETHPDTDINDIMMCCPDCGIESAI